MKKIYLLTRNRWKYREYQRFFAYYNIKVVMQNDFEYFENAAGLMTAYVHLLQNDHKVLNVLFDETQLFRESDQKPLGKIDAQTDGMLVYATTTLYYFGKDKKVATISATPHRGVIDYSAKVPDKKRYGWDDVFVLRPLGLSYQQLKQRGMKNHGRQEVLAKFALQFLYYSQGINLNFNALEQKQAIEFSEAIFKLVATHPLINSPTVKANKLTYLFDYALNNGGFFRSAKNRRQKNYWAPGLNAGIPLVPKKDEVHEITFFVHDLCHFVLPDLIYSGKDAPLYDKVYVIYRMLSEALTLVIADMCFVHALVQDGVQYDFSKRKIYPLYQAILKKHPDISLNELWAANVQYCLLGDDSHYKYLIAKEDRPVLEAFKAKYEAFFVGDFRWTKHNLQSMKNNAGVFTHWYTSNREIFAQQGLWSIQDFTHQKLGLSLDTPLSNVALVHHVRNVVVQHYCQVMEGDFAWTQAEKLSNSFKKYMLGQMLIFYKMDFLPYSQFLQKKFNDALLHQSFDLAFIRRYRQMYDDYLNMLETDYHLIHKDDVETYKEVYPIFDSFYVFYDQAPEAEVSLKKMLDF
ncbi:hypothetical protein [uncultured Microscilla sp.]|uniref:hypothetical protein n=1 Tax=uncultured Microscilla sp. TaxID=432653 RepID=UPI002601E593|nr:hypothetical protein [uncultured Microscilla sp.]